MMAVMLSPSSMASIPPGRIKVAAMYQLIQVAGQCCPPKDLESPQTAQIESVGQICIGHAPKLR